VLLVLCFFFQAEDGIRDATVTGVQTCALPILVLVDDPLHDREPESRPLGLGGDVGLERTVDDGLGKTAAVVADPQPHLAARMLEIGRASCRERGEIWGGAGSLKKEQEKKNNRI